MDPSDRSDDRRSETELAAALDELRRAAEDLERANRPAVDAVPAGHRDSARNLLHYLAMRRFDLHALQAELAADGLSSLGRAEAHVLATIEAVRSHLVADTDADQARPTMPEAVELLERHAADALGPPSHRDRSRIMVTLPGSAATEPGLIHELAAAGMELARINGAHDDPAAWRAMARTVREASEQIGRPIRIMADLPGPKLRTGPLPSGPGVVRVRPRRTAEGHVQRLARMRFIANGRETSPPDSSVTVIPVSDALVDGAHVGDELVLDDHRGRRRRFTVTAVHDHAVDATSDRTSYLASTSPIRRRRAGRTVATGRLGTLPAPEPFLRVHRGDQLRILPGTRPGHRATLDADGSVLEPLTVSCDVPELATAARPGHRVLIDDGQIEAVVTAVTDGSLITEVLRPDEAKLRAGKGINLPDTDLAVAAMTIDDHRTIAELAPHVDLVALSFVSGSADLDAVWDALDQLGRPEVAVVVKIEHAAAFRALPRLLLHGLRRPPVAVMVARGDLAVEVGFERLAEVQEEILWLCEAAHVPVIWATQVLESLAKEGVPTRAEVTDAAWAGRAECVMLNKGPHVVEAVRFLGDVLDRMQGHQRKRTALLRPLAVSEAFETAP